MSVLRRLQGITYWVLEDSQEIRKLIGVNVRKEWESDARDQGEDHQHGAWLGTLSKRRWRLGIARLEDVMLADQIMNFANTGTGYVFRERLKERTKILNRDMVNSGAVIWPIILRAEDNQLMDGYCRYHVLTERRVTKAYAYIGRL